MTRRDFNTAVRIDRDMGFVGNIHKVRTSPADDDITIIEATNGVWAVWELLDHEIEWDQIDNQDWRF